MAPKRTTRANPATITTTTTTFVTDAQLAALIEQGVARLLTTCDADRNTNDDDSHNSGIDMKKKMTDKYCPRGEMKKLNSELWNLRADKIERYVSGLPDVIHGSVVASRPKTMQEAIEMENKLIDKRDNSWAKRQAENKRKVDDTFRSNQIQQQQHNKRQNTRRAYTAGSGEKKSGTSNVNTANNQRGNGTGQKPTCGNATAPAKVYAIGHAGINLDSNVVTGTFLLNNCYDSILFDTGADRSFVSTAFSS
nr:hypothetical protein [Tanacetum cinerariifolium]GFA63640.1 hypothetical protein [Tanacetum cinerariifolium]